MSNVLLPDVGWIYRYTVTVDDEWHDLDLCGDPLAVGCRSLMIVEFWCSADDSPPRRRSFRVVGTGQPFPAPGPRYWGTAVTPDGQLVWHLVERETGP